MLKLQQVDVMTIIIPPGDLPARTGQDRLAGLVTERMTIGTE
jgi:hypothetical protein